MNVVAINGSPRKEGNTYHALKTVATELEQEGIDVRIIQVGDKPIRGCLACGTCGKLKNGRCIIDDDVNDIIQLMKEADGIILGSPVHFSGIAGTMKSFLDRAFYVASANGGLFRHKAGAALVAVRRSGGTAALQQLNAYLLYAELLIPTGNYWNIIHGAAPAEALKDDEGIQTLRTMGKNMAWLLKMKQQSSPAIAEPEAEPKVRTNFIR